MDARRGMWARLPDDVGRRILRFHRRIRDASCARIQARWRCYRARVLLGRFRMLCYLQDFRRHRPAAADFLAAARL